MRRFLDGLYFAGAALAGIFLILIAALVLWQIVGALVGAPPRIADEMAGWSMAASAFLSFGYAFRRGDHIRVTLIAQNLKGTARRAADLWALAGGTFLACYLAWFSVKMTWQSWALNDMTQGLVPVPLWIPQFGMAAGAVVLAVATVDTFVEVLRGGRLIEEDDAANVTMER
ncbi:MAG: TRAP transporter small permease [Alphaproteobacteria bacterium]|nr:TRAP transporter small permease [Alphaproteobacteria bacterium]